MEGWRFFLALGALVSIPVTVTVWLMSQHEARPHRDAVRTESYREFKADMKGDVKEIKRTQQDIALEMAKQSRAIVEFVNEERKERRAARRRRR